MIKHTRELDLPSRRFAGNDRDWIYLGALAALLNEPPFLLWRAGLCHLKSVGYPLVDVLAPHEGIKGILADPDGNLLHEGPLAGCDEAKSSGPRRKLELRISCGGSTRGYGNMAYRLRAGECWIPEPAAAIIFRRMPPGDWSRRTWYLRESSTYSIGMPEPIAPFHILRAPTIANWTTNAGMWTEAFELFAADRGGHPAILIRHTSNTGIDNDPSTELYDGERIVDPDVAYKLAAEHEHTFPEDFVLPRPPAK